LLKILPHAAWESYTKNERVRVTRNFTFIFDVTI
jgi:hypothetical protein